MDRKAYLQALDQALAALVPPQERSDILRYYNEYFDEAGPEGEAAVIEELGDPAALAQRLASEGGYGHPSPTAPRRRRRWLLAAVIAAVVVAAILLLAAVGLPLIRMADRADLDIEDIWSLGGGSSASQGAGGSQADGGNGGGQTSIADEQFSEIDVEVGVADVTIAVGDTYAAELTWDSGSGYSMSCGVQNGVLKVTGSKKTAGSSADSDAKVVITVPNGVTLREIDVEVGLGDVGLDGVAAGEISCETGLGDVSFLNVTASDASGQTGMGDVTWEGALSRETELNTGMGSIKVSAPGTADSWSYELNAGTGQVELDGVNLGHSARQRVSGSGELEASSGAGSVTVTFLGEG